MAGQVVPYNLYEERRRRLLAIEQMRAQPAPPQIAPSPQPSPQDVSAFIPPVPTASQLGPMPLAPEQLSYQDVLGQRPTREEYKPGMLRKILASVAGGATGWRAGAPAGIEAARRVTDLPYERATSDWEQNLRAAMAPMELEQARREEERKIQESRVRGQEAQARIGYYGAAQARAGRPAPPTLAPPGYGVLQPGETEPSYTQPHRPAAPQRPVSVPRGNVMLHPETGAVIGRGMEPAPERTFEQELQLRRAGPEATAALRPTPGIDPTDYNTAEKLATQRVLSDPIYAEFMEWEEGIPGLTEPDPDWDPAKMQRYYDMLEARDEETERILSMMSSGQQVLPPGESNYEGGVVRD